MNLEDAVYHRLKEKEYNQGARFLMFLFFILFNIGIVLNSSYQSEEIKSLCLSFFVLIESIIASAFFLVLFLAREERLKLKEGNVYWIISQK